MLKAILFIYIQLNSLNKIISYRVATKSGTKGGFRKKSGNTILTCAIVKNYQHLKQHFDKVIL